MIPFAAGARNEPLQGGTNGFQIDGASDGENVYLIDGVNTTNIQNGGVGKSFQMDFVEEVQIKSSSFEAEYGGALGGVINADRQARFQQLARFAGHLLPIQRACNAN